MNARVFLLVLFTFAFMGVWDADRPAVRLTKAAKPVAPVASLPNEAHSETPLPSAIHDNPVVPGQETLPLDVQTVLVFVASAPWEAALPAEVPSPVEPVVESSESGVMERAVGLITNLMTNVVIGEARPAEVSPADEQLEVVVTEIEETPVMPEPLTLSQEAAEAFIPLPKNLAAGTWQVMTESGEFYRVTIDKSVSESAAGEAEAIEEEESFSAITTADGVRWCFIRAFAGPQDPGSARQASTEFFGPTSK